MIEAYWKSVAWPGEGVFVGEPLARPWDGAIVTWNPPSLKIETYQLVPNKAYTLESGPGADGPWTVLAADLSVAKNMRATIDIPDASEPFYRSTASPPRNDLGSRGGSMRHGLASRDHARPPHARRMYQRARHHHDRHPGR